MKSSILLKKTCCLFSIITLIYSLILISFFNGLGMNPVSVFLFFPFSLFITIGNQVLKNETRGGVFKISIHFILYTAAVIFFVYLPHARGVSAKNSFILFVIYVVFYILAMLVYTMMKSSKTRKKEENDEYKNVY